MSTSRRSFFKQLGAAVVAAPLAVMATQEPVAAAPCPLDIQPDLIQRVAESNSICGELRGYNRAIDEQRSVAQQYAELYKSGLVSWKETCRIAGLDDDYDDRVGQLLGEEMGRQRNEAWLKALAINVDGKPHTVPYWS